MAEAHQANVATVEARLPNKQLTATKVREVQQLLHNRRDKNIGKELRGYKAVSRHPG